MRNKPRVLFNSEFSAFSTGFSTYYLEVIKRFYESGYEVAELAGFCDPSDPRLSDYPWKVYPVVPHKDDKKGNEVYRADPINTFGKWKFEQTCLDFKPTHIAECRDFWYFAYVEKSPFREFFNHIIFPAVDGQPLMSSWMNSIMDADAVLGYTDWGLDVIKEQCPQAKIAGTASPGIDINAYKVIRDKRSHKLAFGMEPDSLIIMTVMRAQRRKLFPDLIQAFQDFLRKAPKELSDKTFLYLHTCWPDLNWDFPKLLKETDISHRVIFTYMCRTCGAVFPSLFQDAKGICKVCQGNNAVMPTSKLGVPREVLGKIYGLADVYVSYSTNEGFAFPLLEAAASGVYPMAVDHTAMSDVIRKLNGVPIKVKRTYREPETHRIMGLPDNDHLVEELIKFLALPMEARAAKGFMSRVAAEKSYGNWDDTALKWMQVVDRLPPKGNWDTPSRLRRPNYNIPNNLGNTQFVRWCIMNIACDPKLINSHFEKTLLRDLNWGRSIDNMTGWGFNDLSMASAQPNIIPVTRQTVVDICGNIVTAFNNWESTRCGGRIG